MRSLLAGSRMVARSECRQAPETCQSGRRARLDGCQSVGDKGHVGPHLPASPPKEECAMSLMTIDQLDMAVPMARYEDLVKYIDFLNEGMERFEINTPNRIAAFIAQVAHESGDFRYTEENLNYSWTGLRKTWPGKFPIDELAQQYHRQPERIANLVYAGRYGNAGEASGDGWQYRGRGLIQLTFHDNYVAYSRAISAPSLTH